MNVTTLVIRHAHTCHGDAPALTDPVAGITFTHTELAERIACAAGALAQLAHINVGDTVGICIENGWRFAVAFHAVTSLGAIACPLPVTATKEDVQRHRELVKPALNLDSDSFDDLLHQARTTNCPHIFPREVPDTHPAAYPLSSGTTGLPKAVILTHGSLAANITQFEKALPWDHPLEEVVYAVLPMTHIYGLTSLLNVPLTAGAHVIACPFNPATFISDHSTFHVTTTFIAPPLARFFAQQQGKENISTDMSSLRLLVSGAAALAEADAVATAFVTKARLIQGFGLTEASPVTHLARDPRVPVTSIGHPLVNTGSRIVDLATGEPCPAGVPGELEVTGPQLMAGYLNDPVATAAAFHDGWLRTGDIATADDTGAVTIVDRLKDMINYHGFSIAPAKLEGIVITHPAVQDCAVGRGTDHQSGDEIPVACIVAHTTADDCFPSAEEIMAFVAARVAPEEKIRAIRFVDTIPRSGAGKILRRKLFS